MVVIWKRTIGNWKMKLENYKTVITMRLSFPSTLTRKKMMTLFLLTLLRLPKTQAGIGFKNCLNNMELLQNYPNIYSSLLAFPFNKNLTISEWINSGKVINICCSKSHCQLFKKTINFTTLNDAYEYLCYGGIRCFCTSISQAVYCGCDECSGIVGNMIIENNATVGNCEISSEVMESYLKNTTLQVREKDNYAL